MLLYNYTDYINNRCSKDDFISHTYNSSNFKSFFFDSHEYIAVQSADNVVRILDVDDNFNPIFKSQESYPVDLSRLMSILEKDPESELNLKIKFHKDVDYWTK